jgi:hypothetical protein
MKGRRKRKLERRDGQKNGRKYGRNKHETLYDKKRGRKLNKLNKQKMLVCTIV